MAVESIAGEDSCDQRRRRILLTGSLLAVPSLFVGPLGAQAPALSTVNLSVPGPRGSVSLPLELAVRLGFDKAEGINLRLKFVGSGAVTIQDLDAGNADFGVLAMPTVMTAVAATGSPLVALVAINDLPLYTLMVREDLKSKVKAIKDLKGMRIGISGNIVTTKSTSYQLTGLMLKSGGISPVDVSMIAAGRNWETESSAFIAKTVDAMMSDEPFGVRLDMANLAFPLFATGNSNDAKRIAGAGFLRGTLIALQQRVDADPLLVAKMVKIVKRSLAWIAGNSPDHFADAMAMVDDERAAYISVSKKYPRQFSTDGKFSTAQLRETEAFFAASNADNMDARAFRLDNIVNLRWAGGKP